MKNPRQTTVWGTWHQNVGWFSFYPTRSDAILDMDRPKNDSWEMMKRDGWKLIKCKATPEK